MIVFNVVLKLQSVFVFRQESGLTNLIGVYFEEFAQLEPWLLTLVVTTMTTFLTEFISNSAAITMLLPIVGQVVRVELTNETLNKIQSCPKESNLKSLRKMIYVWIIFTKVW